MYTLVSVTFDRAPRIPGVRPGDLSTVDCNKPNTPLLHWTISVRGAAVFFISPPGWVSGRKPHEWDPKGARILHEVPRVDCYLHWSGDIPDLDTILKSKYDSEPLGGPVPDRKPEPTSFLAQLDSKDIGDP